jgi:hypothetical protein
MDDSSDTDPVGRRSIDEGTLLVRKHSHVSAYFGPLA